MTYTCKAPGRRGRTADRKAPPAGPEAAQAPGRRARQGASSTPRRAGTKNPQLIRTHEGPQIPQETLGGKLEGSRRLTWKCTAKAPGGERPAPPGAAGPGRRRGPSREPAPTVVAPRRSARGPRLGCRRRCRGAGRCAQTARPGRVSTPHPRGRQRGFKSAG